MKTNEGMPEVIVAYCTECGESHAILADRNDKSECTKPPKTRYGIVILDRWHQTQIVGDADSLRDCQTKINGVLERVIPAVERDDAEREAHLREIGVASDGHGHALTVEQPTDAR